MQGVHGQRMQDWVLGCTWGAGLGWWAVCRRRVLSCPRKVQGCHWAGAAVLGLHRGVLGWWVMQGEG